MSRWNVSHSSFNGVSDGLLKHFKDNPSPPRTHLCVLKYSFLGLKTAFVSSNIDIVSSLVIVITRGMSPHCDWERETGDGDLLFSLIKKAAINTRGSKQAGNPPQPW